MSYITGCDHEVPALIVSSSTCPNVSECENGNVQYLSSLSAIHLNLSFIVVSSLHTFQNKQLQAQGLTVKTIPDTSVIISPV